MLVVIEYGVGNLFSLTSSLKHIGIDAVTSSDPEIIRSADKLILPGVGAFRDAKAALEKTGLDAVIKEEAAKGKPIMGICLGMQMLFERSFEYGEYEGLGLIPGDIVPIADYVPDNLKIPQIGWNSLDIRKDTPLFKYIEDGDFVYFVHSYFAKTSEDYIIAETEYGAPLTAACQNGNVYGCQFHPEKSERVGLAILKAFDEL
ncbi:MAG: imidazole glycerol phosphate synthase subunit HisH [Firmicutes bacterium]|nr:imidazole glycerol phosphate synthase subunit HisH [Bacillota bacterium]